MNVKRRELLAEHGIEVEDIWIKDLEEVKIV